MDVRHFTVPLEAYSRYRYAREHIPPLLDRFQDIIEKCALKDPFVMPDLGDVHVYLISASNADLLQCSELTRKECPAIKCETLRYDSPEDFKTGTVNQVYVCVASYNEAMNNDQIWQYTKPVSLLIKDESEISVPDMKTPDESLIVSIRARESVSSELDSILERIVYKHLLPRVKILGAFLQTESSPLTFAGFNTSVETELSTRLKKKKKTGTKPESQYSTTHLVSEWQQARLDAIKAKVNSRFGKECCEIKNQICQPLCNSETGIEARSSTIGEHILPYLNIACSGAPKSVPETLMYDINDMKLATETQIQADNIAVRFKKTLDGICDNLNEIEQLHGECMAMYRRSKVPAFEKPTAQNPVPQLEHDMAEAILKIQGVTGCGYRFSTLNVFLNGSLKEEERQSAVRSVQNIIAGKVDKCAFNTEGKIVQLHSVGSRVVGELGRAASLGGFAERGEERKLSVLVARHFAETTKDIYVETNAGRQCIATVIDPLHHDDENDTSDISAGDVLYTVRQNCQTKFKDSRGLFKNSNLEHFEENDLNLFAGLPVHIWGAASSPGLGTIVIPDYYVQGMKRLVKVEDRRVERPRRVEEFAREGDSGSVVCADDPEEEYVHVVSMLMGRSDVVDHNSVTLNQYLTFRLRDGLLQLERQTGEQFHIC